MSNFTKATFNLEPHQAPKWAPEKHSQTILADLIPSQKLRTHGKTFTVDLLEGDKTICHFFEGTSPFIILLGHGLSGDALSGYNQRLTQIFLKQGHSVCLMNHRNCGVALGLAKKPYCGGRSEDFSRIIFDLKKQYPTKKIILIGFSMSGNASLLLSSHSFPIQNIFDENTFLEKKEELQLALPDQVIAVNPPFDLKNTALKFKENINRLYEINFINNLVKIVDDLVDKKLVDPSKRFFKKPKTLIEFDDFYTGPLLGYKDADEFYKMCSSARYIHNSTIPTVLLTSTDDPIVDFEDFKNSNPSHTIQVHTESSGGHMGYLNKSKTTLGTYRWMDYALNKIVKTISN